MSSDFSQIKQKNSKRWKTSFKMNIIEGDKNFCTAKHNLFYIIEHAQMCVHINTYSVKKDMGYKRQIAISLKCPYMLIKL